MGPSRKRAAPHSDPAEQESREQEVLRANKELAAYFKGRRTEREARAALKIIKAFIRNREHLDPANRRPLPGAESAKAATKVGKHKTAAAPEKIRRRRPGRQPQAQTSRSSETEDITSSNHEVAPSIDE